VCPAPRSALAAGPLATHAAASSPETSTLAATMASFDWGAAEAAVAEWEASDKDEKQTDAMGTAAAGPAAAASHTAKRVTQGPDAVEQGSSKRQHTEEELGGTEQQQQQQQQEQLAGAAAETATDGQERQQQQKLPTTRLWRLEGRGYPKPLATGAASFSAAGLAPPPRKKRVFSTFEESAEGWSKPLKWLTQCDPAKLHRCGSFVFL
jgi:hypothetical protein